MGWSFGRGRWAQRLRAKRRPSPIAIPDRGWPDRGWQLQGVLSDPLPDRISVSVSQQWTRDQAWASKATLIDGRKPGFCGGGACNLPYCNWQYWSIAGHCDPESFESVMFQFARFQWAQDQLRRKLARPPSPGVIGVSPPTRIEPGVVRSLAGRPQEWAVWCNKVLELVGLARWCTNVRWDDLYGSSNRRHEIGVRRSITMLAGARGTPEGRRPPTWICHRRGSTPEGWYPQGSDDGRCPDPLQVDPFSSENVALESIVELSSHVSAFDQMGSRITEWDLYIGNRGTDRLPALGPLRVPTRLADFAPRMRLSLTRDTRLYSRSSMWPWPRGIERPSRSLQSSAIAMMERYFRFLPRDEAAQQAWHWRFPLKARLKKTTSSVFENRDRTVNTQGAYPSSVMVVRLVEAMALDLTEVTFGTIVERAMTQWLWRYELLPDRFKAATPDDLAQIQRDLTQSKLDEAAAMIYAAGSAVGPLLALAGPVGGVISAVVQIIVAVVGALVMFAQELGLTRADPPMCPPPPLIRMIMDDDTLACDFRPDREGGYSALLPQVRLTEELARRGVRPRDWHHLLDEITRDGGAGSGDPPREEEAPAKSTSLLPLGLAAAAGVGLIAYAAHKKKEKKG